MSSSIKISEERQDFFKMVYEVVKLIPKGRVTNYGSIAKYLSTPKASRAVGFAMNSAHSNPNIPAHRVVNRNGMLTGRMHFDSPTKMEELLNNEGILVKDDKIVDFNKVFWDPEKELIL